MENEEKAKEVTCCKICHKEVQKSKLIMHITRNVGCEKGYGSDLDILKKEKAKAKQKYQEKYREVYNEKNKDSLKRKRALKYIENKAKKSNNLIEKQATGVIKSYDPAKRREMYQREKEEKATIIRKIANAQKKTH